MLQHIVNNKYFLVAPRYSTSQDAVCVEIFFSTNPYLQAGLTDLDEIWHDGGLRG